LDNLTAGQFKTGGSEMQDEDNPLIDAILAVSSFTPEEAVKRYEAIKEIRRKNAAETLKVPKALGPLYKRALEEKARREQ
jgi:hypothetical protein